MEIAKLTLDAKGATCIASSSDGASTIRCIEGAYSRFTFPCFASRSSR